ncbi:MAG TPA: RidA family protein, partial [Myxococcaceae bacterium]|nr:RidA family protein [Myxococcaceae bacterium]
LSFGCANARSTGPSFSNPPALSTPRGYTHVVDVPAGRTLYISGQVALDEKGNLVGPGDARAQAEQVFRNLRAALASSGATLADVVKLTWYVKDTSQLATYREVREQFLGSGPRPASTLVEVKGLFREDVLLEVDAIAAPRN